MIGNISSVVQNTLDPLEQVLGERFPDFVDDQDGIQRVLDFYAAKKRAAQLLDYDDLLSQLHTLLTDHPEARGLLAEKFQHVLVDEYQDTNVIQGAIVDLMASKHGNLCVVGDDSQSIYSFRGASFDNFLRIRERYPSVREFRLETNYRSTPEILAVANESIAVNERRLPKQLRAVRSSDVMPAVVSAYDHLVQSRFVAEYVLQLLDEGRGLLDIAVLYRSNWHSMEIQLELQRHNIPFEVRGGLRFFEQAHIKDVLAFLRIIQNPRDEIEWMRALQLLPKIGAVLARRCWDKMAYADNPLIAALDPDVASALPRPSRASYTEFIAVIRHLAHVPGPGDMIEGVLDQFYDGLLTARYDNAASRREDIRGLATFAAQYRSVDGLMADVSLAGDFSGETVVEGPDSDEFVTLSTVHQAKGLEWDVVIISWLVDGYFPTDFAINSQDDEEEERRVFHVAVTRAKDELYFVVPQVRRSHSAGFVLMKPSRFLTELPDDVTEAMELEDGLPELIAGGESSRAQASRYLSRMGHRIAHAPFHESAILSPSAARELLWADRPRKHQPYGAPENS